MRILILFLFAAMLMASCGNNTVDHSSQKRAMVRTIDHVSTNTYYDWPGAHMQWVDTMVAVGDTIITDVNRRYWVIVKD